MKAIINLFWKCNVTNDKAMHFICGATLSVILGLFLANTLYGALAGILAGVGKEVYDYCELLEVIV